MTSPPSRPGPVRAPAVPPAADRRFATQLPLIAVLAVVAAGLAVIALHHFRLGSFLVACGVLLGAGLRMRLSAHRAGLLVVRSRALDVTVLGALGAAVLVLTFLVPPLRP